MSHNPFRFTPCYERWQDMLPSERGRLCAKCQTEIVDFRNSTEAEIERTIAESPVRICGYYSLAQLQKPGSRLAAAAAAATIALGVPAIAEAALQEPTPRVIPDAAPSDSTVFHGQVTDTATGIPLHGAQVWIADTRQGTITDADGRFRIVVRQKFEQPVRLLVQFIGYEARSIELVPRNGAVELRVALPQAAIGIVGIVVTESDVKPHNRPSIWRRIWRFLGGS